MDSDGVTRLSAAELVDLIAAKEISPVEVTKAYLERIDRFDCKLDSYITVCRRQALQTAREAEEAVIRGDDLGPLHGIPFAVKDQFETEGILTTAGSTILGEYMPEEDATVVARARAAGAILLGKHNMTEFAAGLGDRFKYGEPKNPWDRTRDTGGSSTGSAIAVAASLCALAIGEDTGGSVRMPASLAGIVGVRPSWGLLSRHGVVPICWSMDSAGPMSRTVRDAALLLGAIAGYDPKDPLTANLPVPNYVKSLDADLRGIRIGVLDQPMGESANEDVLEAVGGAAVQLEALGVKLDKVSLPLASQMGSAMSVITGSAGAFVCREWLRTRPDDFGPNLRRRWLAPSLFPGQALEKAKAMRALLRREWYTLFADFDVLISPTLATTARKIEYDTRITSQEEAEKRLTWQKSTCHLAAMCGTPAMTVPCGFDTQNLPIGLQIMTGRFEEALMFQVGHAYEQSTDWHTQRPSLD
jgi:aspartyl-tRNA(Asn)/glutamyl-tRNA(Gln) amidotransferase subunit A